VFGAAIVGGICEGFLSYLEHCNVKANQAAIIMEYVCEVSWRDSLFPLSFFTDYSICIYVAKTCRSWGHSLPYAIPKCC